MSDTTTYIQPTPQEKNGITITPVDVTIKRGDKSGTVYPIAQIDIPVDDKKNVDTEKVLANIINYVKWRGPAIIAKALNGIEKQDGQVALEAAAEFATKEVTNPDDPNKKDTVYYISSVDSAEYWKYYLSDTMRGGITKGDLITERDALATECRNLIVQCVNPTTSATDRMSIMQRVAEMNVEIQGLEEAIAARSRERKSKTASPAPAVVPTPAVA